MRHMWKSIKESFSREEEVTGRSEADHTDQGMVAVAHPWPPIEKSFGNDDTILASRPHQGNAPWVVSGQIKSHRSSVAIAARKDAIYGAGGSGAIPSITFEICQYLSGPVGKDLTGFGASHRV